MEIEREYCSNSGSDSGWTIYLESYSSPSNNFHKKRGKIECDEDHYTRFYCDHQQDEDDLSMVSDASSGPPLHDIVYHHDNDVDDDHEENNDNYYYNKNKNNNGSKIKRKINLKSDDFALDDTASSPFFFFPSKKNINGGKRKVENQGSSLESSIDYSSQGFSATHFQGRSMSTKYEQDGYGFFRSPHSTEIYQQNQLKSLNL